MEKVILYQEKWAIVDIFFFCRAFFKSKCTQGKRYLVSVRAVRAVAWSNCVCTVMIGEDENACSNFRQYSLESKFIDMVVADAAHHPWKEKELFDAIVTDRE